MDRNGGGTYAVTYSMSTEVKNALAEMSELGGGGGMPTQDMPDMDEIDEGELRRICKENDVELTEFERSGKDGVETVKMAFAFKDLDGLNAAVSSAMGKGGSGIALYRTAEGDYVLKGAQDPEPTEAEMEEAAMEQPAAAGMESMDMEKIGRITELSGKLMASIGEMDVVFRITPPGEILSHNAPAVEDGACVWRINAQNMMQASDLDPEIIFSGKGLDLEAPAWK